MIGDEEEGLPGPYDGAGAEELWFLPDAADDPSPPLPKADRQGLVDSADWRAAEAGLAGDLAELAFDAGRLAERLPSKWLRRAKCGGRDASSSVSSHRRFRWRTRPVGRSST